MPRCARRGSSRAAAARGAGRGCPPTGPPRRRPRRPAPDLIDLSTAASAAPEGALHAALAAATAELPRHLPAPGYYEHGLPALRAAVAERFTARGAPTTPDQILMTSGALHAFALLLRVLAGPGDRVLTEHPSYPAALDAIRALGARPVPVARWGTWSCWRRRCARPRRGSPTSSPTTTTRPGSRFPSRIASGSSRWPAPRGRRS